MLMFMFVSTAATMTTQSQLYIKEEPVEEVLPSTAVYSTSMCIGRVYVTLCLLYYAYTMYITCTCVYSLTIDYRTAYVYGIGKE